jgi:hypothetical protein
MLPEQIPGTLFVIILLLVGLATASYFSLMLLALGCALGWLGFSRDLDYRVRNGVNLVALLVWAYVFIALTLEIL